MGILSSPEQSDPHSDVTRKLQEREYLGIVYSEFPGISSAYRYIYADVHVWPTGYEAETSKAE